MFNKNMKVNMLFSTMFPIVMLLVNFSNIGVMWVGAHQIDSGKMAIGSLTAITTYMLQIFISVTISAMMLFLLPRAQISAKRIGRVLNTKSSISFKYHDGEIDKLSKDAEVTLKHVSFMYKGSDKNVLSDISFSSKKGEITAIIGSTGSGKSTIMSLITRFVDATSGTVYVGGENVKDLKLEKLWSEIGLVPQKSYLFSGTIRDNLLFGNKNASEQDMWQALEISQAKNFVKRLPDKLDSFVAAGGTNFSGGQKQRLSIARAIIRKPPIYLFDDSFSALDFVSEAKLRSALIPIIKNSTAIVVAQRVGSIMYANQIIVLDKGKIVGKGTHNELLQKNKVYQEIVYSQGFSDEELGLKAKEKV
jgi:ATP-binding cassette subfamily B protein